MCAALHGKNLCDINKLLQYRDTPLNWEFNENKGPSQAAYLTTSLLMYEPSKLYTKPYWNFQWLCKCWEPTWCCLLCSMPALETLCCDILRRGGLYFRCEKLQSVGAGHTETMLIVEQSPGQTLIKCQKGHCLALGAPWFQGTELVMSFLRSLKLPQDQVLSFFVSRHQ